MLKNASVGLYLNGAKIVAVGIVELVAIRPPGWFRPPQRGDLHFGSRGRKTLNIDFRSARFFRSVTDPPAVRRNPEIVHRVRSEELTPCPWQCPTHCSNPEQKKAPVRGPIVN